jgi:hypothetical protein
VHPAALMLSTRIDGAKRRGQSGTAVGENQLQGSAFQSAPVQVL